MRLFNSHPGAWILSGLLIGMAACTPEPLNEVAPQQAELTIAQDPIPPAELWRLIESKMENGKVFHWSSLSDHELWSAGLASDSLFSVGYWKDANHDRAADMIGLIDVEERGFKDQLEKLLNEVLRIESAAKGSQVSRTDLLPMGQQEFVPQITLRLSSAASLSFLRNHPNVRYVEPMGYDPEAYTLRNRSSSGCGVNPNFNLPAADFNTVSPNVKAPWNFDIHRIRDAWTLSQGAGVSIQIIDTGSSDDQENVGSAFASGQSTGRSITRLSTLYSGWWWWRRLLSPDDPCGHGTQMSGLATAPRGSDGNAVGVAYRSNLTIVRAVEDVVITSSDESAGVRDALILAGNNSAIRIVSMSIGTPFYNSTVADGVFYAHNRGKLIFAAAGTSFSWTSWWGVIFPANMSQVVAVTGVKEGLPLERCASCHDGPEVEFIIHMARRHDPDRTSLSLSPSGNQPTYVGGSSSATATTAGIAALVWSRNPGWNRTQVLDRLRQASSLHPNRSSNFGWGAIDAMAAVSGNL